MTVRVTGRTLPRHTVLHKEIVHVLFVGSAPGLLLLYRAGDDLDHAITIPIADVLHVAVDAGSE